MAPDFFSDLYLPDLGRFNQNHQITKPISKTPVRFTNILIICASIVYQLALNQLKLDYASADSFFRRRRLALLTTVTEDIAMAAPAKAGFSSQPKIGNKTPAASGIPMLL